MQYWNTYAFTLTGAEAECSTTNLNVLKPARPTGASSASRARSFVSYPLTSSALVNSSLRRKRAYSEKP